jgi:hypothetical protein
LQKTYDFFAPIPINLNRGAFVNDSLSQETTNRLFNEKMKIMKNHILLFFVILILINLIEQIFRFWKKSLRPNFKKLYFIPKNDVAVFYDTPTIWNRITAVIQVYYYTLKSLVPILHKHIYISIRSSKFSHRAFPQSCDTFPNGFMLNQKVEWPLQYGIMVIPGGNNKKQSGIMKNQSGNVKKQNGNIKKQNGNIKNQSGKTSIQNGNMKKQGDKMKKQNGNIKNQSGIMK